MALSRRRALLTLPFFASALTACARGGIQTVRSGYMELSTTGSGTRGRVLVFMPDTPQTREVWTGLADELARDMALVAVRIAQADEVAHVERALATHRPHAIVLVNNPTVAAYRAYQRAHPGAVFPPAVVLMTSLLDEENLDIRNATGVRYEVPLVTAVTNLRRLIATPILRVGVIHRAPFDPLIQFEAKLAAREKVRVEREVVGASPNESEIKRAIRRIKARSDALWVLNDDRLLTPHLLAEGWRPGLTERPWVPTLVGVRSLVAANGFIGTFAVLPDHTAFGAQAADILFEAADEGWSLADAKLKLPVSTTTIVDLAQARERFALREDALSQVDVILSR